MKKNIWVMILCSLCWFGDCVCYIYKKFVKTHIFNKQTGNYQTVIGLGDYHDKLHPANNQQKLYIELLLKRCALLKSKLIVEDLSSINNDGKMTCCNYAINCSNGILGQLAHKARLLGVSVDNVEYRYCRVASIGPLLTNPQLPPQSCVSSSSITTEFLRDEVLGEIEKIKKYNDGKMLNALYKRVLNQVANVLSKCAFGCSNNKTSIADVCYAMGKKHNYREQLEHLCVFDSSLIDMKIMHSIISSPDAATILIIAGGSHIEQVGMLLDKIGYKNCIDIGDVTSTISIQKGLNFDSSCPPGAPQPIDISAVDTYIR